MAEKVTVRCVGCGKTIRPKTVKDPGDPAVDIRMGLVVEKGKRYKDGFRTTSAWGRMHQTCFNRAIEATDQLAQIGA